MNKQKYAFTLVELIVVITILAILGTIAFISLQGYSRDARDSVRISDMSRIKTSLELFQLDAGKYPEVTTPFEVTYKGGATWTQGTFGNSTFSNVSRLDKIPKDPSTNREYIYSVTNTKQEYELAGIMEGDITAFNPLLIDVSLAGDKLATAKVSGNYNGKILKVSTGGLVYVVAVPSLITTIESTLEDIVTNNKFVYNGYKNLPYQYEGSTYNTDGEEGSLLLVNPASYELHSGATLESLSGEDSTDRITLLQNMKAAYLGTSITEDSTIQEILSITDFSETNPVVVDLAGTVVNNNLGASISTSGTSQNNTTDEEIVLDPLIETGTNGNIALNGYNGLTSISYSASSSSEWDIPGGAFDGYANLTKFNNDAGDQLGRGIWIAGSTSNEWLQVDFGKKVNMTGFKLINRDTVLERSSKDVIVMISDDMENWTSIPYTLPEQLVVIKDFDELMQGRYFRFFVTNNYGGPYLQIEDIEIYQEVSSDIDSGLQANCKEILINDPSKLFQNGIYTIDPDNNGVGFSAYCDMTTDGGGWTMVGKQTNFQSGKITYNSGLRGSTLITTESYNGTTQGSIINDIPYTKMLFKSSSSKWFSIETKLSDFSQYLTALYCRDLSQVSNKASNGIDLSLYKHLALRMDAAASISSFMIGQYYMAEPPSTQCGGVWCSSNRDGRYNGSCQNGNAGTGNWMFYVK